jgi:hypothetical protein
VLGRGRAVVVGVKNKVTQRNRVIYIGIWGPNNRQNSGDLKIQFKFLVPEFLAWKWLDLA